MIALALVCYKHWPRWLQLNHLSLYIVPFFLFMEIVSTMSLI
jgi:hypothetical protein